MAYPEEGVWKKRNGMLSHNLVRAGSFILSPDDRVEWEVQRHGDRFYAVNNYFTWAEAWDNAWMESFDTEAKAVEFARQNALIAKAVMEKSRRKHGKADAQDIAAVVNVGRYEPPPPGLSGSRNTIHAAMAQAFNLSAKWDFSDEFLSTPEVHGLLENVRRSGGKAIALIQIGDVCVRRLSWEDATAPCEYSGEELLAQGYRVLNTMPLKSPWTSDLNEEQLVNFLPTYSRAQIRKAMKAYEDDSTRTIQIHGQFTIYGDLKPHVPVSLNGPGSKDEPVGAHNRIGHVSDWEGTLRSYKALTALNRFHPRSAGQIAQIFLEEQNPLASMREVQFPMFLENTDLYNFVLHNLDREAIDRAGNYFATHWSLSDAISDMWKLSPELQKAYPTKDRWFSGVNIGEGWHDLYEKVQKILRNAE